ncbi:hypothetical protein Slin15195_G108720 [Septoria linicola]|uniref:Uncharacterized protein n=1 Tax=Septoria linicola TaxID=215465 RepID=A0A9Q9B4X2_9PEZI|nr:hypothetical protein Slin14017_G107020 [Septoria linicola]USW57553.1 hypothetical protein Slin15195_G108720 [Septoria linicola]
MDGLWSDVKENCHFHIALATKLQSEEIFLDAMRHFIGSRSNLSDLTSRLFFDAGYAFEIACIRECQRRRTAVLMKDIQGLTLATCIPDIGPRFLGPAKPLKTCFFSSAHDPSHHERVRGIARHIFTEWLSHQLHGEKHQAYVEARIWPWEFEEITTIDVDSPMTSFRNACTLALESVQTGNELKIFDINAAEAFVRASSLAASPYTTLQVQAELKMLVNEMANLARPLLMKPDYTPVQPYSDFWSPDRLRTPTYDSQSHRGGPNARGRGCGRGYRAPSPERGTGTIPEGALGYKYTFINDELSVEERRETRRKENADHSHPYRYGMTANDDSEIHYFTATRFDESYIPWKHDKKLSMPYKIHGLRPASRKWLKALELLDEGDDDEGEDGNQDLSESV